MFKNLFNKFLSSKISTNGSLKENLETVLDTVKKDDENITKQERSMLLNVLKIDQIRSIDIMIPRADIGAVEVNDSFEKVLEVFIKESHSRVPVYEKNLDNIIGMIHIKDLVKYQNDGNFEEGFLKKIKRDIIEIPPSMPVLDLLMKMQLTRLHMGIVIDEYGGTDGLVTIEDVIEEITGEIEDEHDVQNMPMLTQTSPNSFEASARVEIKEFEKLSKINFFKENNSEDVETLGGLVVAMAGRVPQRGEILKHESGLTFEINDADPKRIKSIKITYKKP
tara:strand:- start:36 stop:872 length:837 start_codon:yes stop_codon:yes gene_type:complete